MYRDKKISVAMATYNGEKFIEEQLLSICNNTVKPDEIIISDDGSKDKTLEIVRMVADSEVSKDIEFIIIKDNPNHGYSGNFEWALKHTSGDYIFFSDQDDVWMPEKVKTVIDVFLDLLDAEMICHNATLIDENGNGIEGVFDGRFSEGKLNVPKGKSVKIDRDTYLESAVSWGGIHGMSVCIERKLVESTMPFPPGIGQHDKWLTFCSVINDSCYYLNEPLAQYRLHGKNTCGNKAYKGKLFDRIKRKLNRLKESKIAGYCAMYSAQGHAMKNKLEVFGYKDSNAYNTAVRICQISDSLYDAETNGRICGAIKLCKIFCTDMRYRRSGTSAFIQELIYIFIHSKKYRIAAIGERL